MSGGGNLDPEYPWVASLIQNAWVQAFRRNVRIRLSILCGVRRVSHLQLRVWREGNGNAPSRLLCGWLSIQTLAQHCRVLHHKTVRQGAAVVE
jgi:hypothetical protein